MPIYKCESCQSTISHNTKVCPSCNSIFDEVVNIKGSDYDIISNSDGTYDVKTTKGEIYKVEEKNGKLTCSCKAFQYSKNGSCKHCDGIIQAGIHKVSAPPRRFQRKEIDYILKLIKPVLDTLPKWEAVGSYRRGLPTSKDIDILAVGNHYAEVKKLMKEMFPTGDQKKSTDKVAPAGTGEGGKGSILRWYVPLNASELVLIDFMFISEDIWEPSLMHFTGCLSPDKNYILSNGGYIKGTNLTKYNSCFNGENWVHGELLNSGFKEEYKLSLDDGSSIYASENHMFKVWSPDSSPVWKKLKDLKVSDALLSCHNIYPGNPTKWNNFELTERLAFALGWFVGDGNYRGIWYFNREETEECDYVEQTLLSNFDKVTKYYKPNPQPTSTGAKRQEVITLSVSKKLDGHLAYFDFNKIKIFEIILTSPIEQRKKFIQGLFGADGSYRQAVCYVSKSEEFVDLTQLILKSLGFNSKKYFTKTKQVKKDGSEIKRWSLNISVTDYARFRDEIGAFGKKIADLDNLVENTLLRSRVSGRLKDIPAEASPLLFSFLNNQGFGDLITSEEKNMYGWYHLKRPRVLTRTKLVQLLDLYERVRIKSTYLMDLDDIPALRNIRTQEFRFVTKVELTGRLVDMIDLSIDDQSHSFVVNGAITHNSAGYNKYLRAIAKEKGYALSQNGLVDRETKKLISNKEKEIMSYLGVDYLPPNQRNY